MKEGNTKEIMVGDIRPQTPTTAILMRGVPIHRLTHCNSYFTAQLRVSSALGRLCHHFRDYYVSFPGFGAYLT